MRGSLRWCLASLLLLSAANACTQDFGAFRFGGEKAGSDSEEDPKPRHDAGEGSDETSESPATDPPPATEPQAGMAAHPIAPVDAGSKPPPAMSIDAGPVPDAASDEDASVVVIPPPPPPGPPQLCAADWPTLQTGTDTCRDCACGSCAQPMVDCLGLADEADRAACRDVLACAMRNQCQIGDCYCRGNGCGAPSESGDGPCAAVIEHAAGGKRSVVQRKLQDETLTDEPLGRAQRAIGCLFGTDDASPGPTLPASCGSACRVIRAD